MLNFSYHIPVKMHFSTNIPILDQEEKPVMFIQRQRHKFLATLANLSLRYKLPYCYFVMDTNEKPIYRTDCLFPGFRNQLIDFITSKSVSISRRRVNVTDKHYSLTLDNNDYHFEKDFWSVAHLSCNHKTFASVSMSNETPSPKIRHKIIIKAENERIAALAAVLYQTFFYFY